MSTAPAAPLVTVLLAVYNGERYVAEAIESVLGQTFRDFELLIIDDGSTDATAAILDRYARGEGRIRIDHQPHRGLVAALNHGLRTARGRYIARMDADDVSLPERLNLQVAFLDAHEEIGVCGTWIKTFGNVSPMVWETAPDDASIRCQIIFESPLANPSSMMRREVLIDALAGYDPAYEHAEDYDFWARAAAHTRLASLPQVLVHLRQHPRQVTRCFHDDLVESARRVRERQVRDLGLAPTPAELALHESISTLEIPAEREFVSQAEAWLGLLLAANRTSRARPEPAFTRTIQRQWFRVCLVSNSPALWLAFRFWRSPLVSSRPPGWWRMCARMSINGLRHWPVAQRARRAFTGAGTRWRDGAETGV